MFLKKTEQTVGKRGLLSTILHKKKGNSQSNHISRNGEIADDTSKLPNYINSFFAKVGKNLANKFPASNSNFVDNLNV